MQACPQSLGNGDTRTTNYGHYVKLSTLCNKHATKNSSGYPCTIQDLAGFCASISSDRLIHCQSTTCDALVPRQVPRACSNFHIRPHSAPPSNALTPPPWQVSHTQATPTHHSHPAPPRHLQSIVVTQLLPTWRHTPATNPWCSNGLPRWWRCANNPGHTHTHTHERTLAAPAYNVKHTQPQTFTISGFCSTRYVDNRCTLIPTANLVSSSFYHHISTAHPKVWRPSPDSIFPASLSTPGTTAPNTTSQQTSQTSCSLSLHPHQPFYEAALQPVPFWRGDSAVDTAMQQLTEVYTRAGYFACSAPIVPGMQLHDLQTYHIPAFNCRHPWQLFAPSICKQFECAMSSPTALSRTCLKRNVLHWLMLLMLCCPRAAQFKRGRRQHIEKLRLIQQFR